PTPITSCIRCPPRGRRPPLGGPAGKRGPHVRSLRAALCPPRGRRPPLGRPGRRSDMQTQLAPEHAQTARGREAEAILRKCVHCGFCTATCPTYQLLGDELDGPRGRIYLIKQVLE